MRGLCKKLTNAINTCDVDGLVLVSGRVFPETSLPMAPVIADTDGDGDEFEDWSYVTSL